MSKDNVKKAEEGPETPTEKDGNVVTAIMKTLDANKYATKKTIAQGLLDVALLTANASQLKYILQVGQKHEFYTLMLTLIIISIILQVTAALIGIVVANFKMHEDGGKGLIGNIMNHVALAFVTGTLFCDIIRMNFGLDPALAVIQGILCAILGTVLDINKEHMIKNAERANNWIVAINVVLVAINIVISVFEGKDYLDLGIFTTTADTTPATTPLVPHN